MKDILLTSIYDAIAQITFPQPRHPKQARNLAQAIFNTIISDGADFIKMKSFHSNYFRKIISNPADVSTVLRELKNAGIIEESKSYSTGFTKKDGEYYNAHTKTYRFSENLIYNNPIHFTTFKGINKIDDRVKFKKIKKNLELISIDPSVYQAIPKVVEAELLTIEIGNNIKNKMISIKMDNKIITKPLPWWLKVATRNGIALIKFHDKFYIEGAKSFIERKRVELEISYSCAIERLKNGNFYANRNDTNNRLDYNCTGLKKEFWPYIIFDNEKTEEVDIKNAQFAVMSNLTIFDMDDIFIEKAQNGQLYEYLMAKLSMTREQVKEYLIVVMFGEAKYHPKKINEIFPVTMKSISDFKNKYGYESFSIALQKGESNLMIDGIFNMLSNKKIPTLPVHDSMRVKASEVEKVQRLMEEFFLEKNFKCTLKTK